MSDPYGRIKTAVGNLRVLGFLFAALSALPMVIFRRSDHIQGALNLTTVCLVLLLPGAVYIVGSFLLPRHSVSAAEWVMRTAFLQPVLVVVALVAGNWVELQSAIMSGGIAMFFIPAVVVQAFQLRRALRDIRELPEPQRGFEAIPMAGVTPGPLQSSRHEGH